MVKSISVWTAFGILFQSKFQKSERYFEMLSDLNQSIPNHLADESPTRVQIWQISKRLFGLTARNCLSLFLPLDPSLLRLTSIFLEQKWKTLNRLSHIFQVLTVLWLGSVYRSSLGSVGCVDNVLGDVWRWLSAASEDMQNRKQLCWSQHRDADVQPAYL